MAKKETPNPKDLARIETAWTISKECSDIVAKIVEAGGECDDATMQELALWQGALESKAQDIALVKCRLEAEAAYYKQIEEAARARRKANEGAADKLKKYLAISMKTAGLKSIKKTDSLFSISLVAGRSSVAVSDPGLLPMELTTIIEQIKPKTDEIKAKLEKGEAVPGASLEYGADYVMIRGGNGSAE